MKRNHVVFYMLFLCCIVLGFAIVFPGMLYWLQKTNYIKPSQRLLDITFSMPFITIIALYFLFKKIYYLFKLEKYALETEHKFAIQAQMLKSYDERMEWLNQHQMSIKAMETLNAIQGKGIDMITAGLKDELDRSRAELKKVIGKGLYGVITNAQYRALVAKVYLKLNICTTLAQTAAPESAIADAVRELLEYTTNLVSSSYEERIIEFSIIEKKTEYIFTVECLKFRSISSSDELNSKIEEINGKLIIKDYALGFLIPRVNIVGKPILHIV